MAELGLQGHSRQADPHDRPEQGRAAPAGSCQPGVRRAGAEQAPGLGIRDADLGRLVPSSPAAGAYRQQPAGRSCGTLFCDAGRAGHRSLTQTKPPPAKPGAVHNPQPATRSATVPCSICNASINPMSGGNGIGSRLWTKSMRRGCVAVSDRRRGKDHRRDFLPNQRVMRLRNPLWPSRPRRGISV